MRYVTIPLAVLLLLGFSACGGGGGGTAGSDGGAGGAPSFTILFEDDFEVFPSSKWTISSVFLGDYELGIAAQDAASGSPTAPSLRLEGNVRASAFGGAFPTAGGLQIFVRVQLPSDTLCATDGLDTRIAPLFELRDASTNRQTALIEVWRNACAAGDTTEIRYTLWPEPNNSTRAVNATIERLASGSVSGTDFWEFSFILFSDGSASLRRNGVARVVSSPPYAPTHVTWSLAGFSPRFTGRTLAPVSVRYDDVVVVKPN